MPAKVYDWSANQWAMIPDSDVTKAVADGTHSFDQDAPVPVISPDGQLGSVKGANVQQAFQQGYRFATQTDAQAWADRGKSASNDQIFGQHEDVGESLGTAAKLALGTATGGLTLTMPGIGIQDPRKVEALAQGTIGGIMPAGNAAVRDIAGPVSRALGTPLTDDDLKASQREIADRHPVENIAGNLLGTGLSPLTRLAGAAGKAVGSEAGALVHGLGNGSAATDLVAKMAGAGLGSAIDGAYFSGSDAINESSIGNPDEVAENLAAGVGSGAVFGGLFGTGLGALGYAAPAIGKAFRGVSGVVKNAADWTAKAVTEKGALFAAPTAEMKEDVAKVWSNKEFRDLVAQHGYDKAVELTGGYEAAQKDFQKTSQGTLGEIFDHIKGEHASTQQAISAAMEKSGGDIMGAMDGMHATQQDAKEALDMALERADQGQIASDTYKQAQANGSFIPREYTSNPTPSKGANAYEATADNTRTLADGFRKSGNEVQETIGKRYDKYIKAQENAAGITAEGSKDAMSAQDEIRTTMQLRDMAAEDLKRTKGLTAEGRQSLQEYHDGLTTALHAHPEFGQYVRALDERTADLHKMQEFVGAKVGDKAKKLTGSANGVMEKLVSDPEYRATAKALFSELPDHAPLLNGVLENAAHAGIAQDQLDALNEKIGKYGRRLSMDEAHELADALFKAKDAAGYKGPTDLPGRLQALRGIQDMLADPATSTPDGMVRALKAMGKELPAGVQEFIPHWESLEALNRIRAQSTGDVKGLLQNPIAKFLAARLGKGAIAGAVGSYIGHESFEGIPGAVGGGLAGFAAGALLGKVQAPTVMKSFEALQKLDGYNTAAYNKVNAAMDAAIKGLSGEAFRTAGLKGIADVTRAVPEPVTRETFQKQAEYVTKLASDLNYKQSEAQSRIGDIPSAPNITSAMHSQYARIVDLTAQAFPKDPLAASSMFPQKTKWTPSDTELSSLNRYVSTLENPLTALGDIARGDAMPEQIQAMQQGYPKMWSRLQQGVMDAIMAPDTDIPYEKRVQIGRLFGITSDYSLQPQTINALQTRFQSGGGGDQKTPGQGAGTKMHVRQNPAVQFSPDRYSTPTEQATFK